MSTKGRAGPASSQKSLQKPRAEKSTEESSGSKDVETDKRKETKEKETQKASSLSLPSSKFSKIKKSLVSSKGMKTGETSNPKQKKTSKTKTNVEKQEQSKKVLEKQVLSKEGRSQARVVEDSAKRTMVQTKLSNTKEGIEVISSPEQPQQKLQRKKSEKKSRSAQSLEKQSKGKEKKQTKISNIFPVRKSNRKCKSVQEKEEVDKITKTILSKKEEGLEVRDIEDKGRGVFATRPFTKNEFVCEYSGELISYEEAKKREKTYGDNVDIGCYMYYLEWNNKKYCIDATEENDTFGRLLNHSRSGNCKTKLHVVKNTPHLILVTTRNVNKGEELLYDYGDRNKQAIESHPWLKY